MKQVRLIYNAIVGGKFYNAGDPIDLDILPSNLRQYITKRQTGTRPEQVERHLSFELNTRYSVDSEGFLRGSPARQAAEMEAAISQEEAIEDELADAELSPTLEAAIREGQADHQNDVELTKAQLATKIRRQEQAEDFIQEEKDQQLAEGEFDQYNADALRDPPPRAPAPRAPAKSKPKAAKGRSKSFVRRNGQFVLTSNVENLIEGEPLYRRRRKSFGVSERYITFGKVRKEANV